MEVYENNYFGMRLQIPDPWKLTCAKTSKKIAKAKRTIFQRRDDEFPEPGDYTSKCLFVASRPDPESPAMVEGDIEVLVFRRPPDHDMGKQIAESFAGQQEYYRSNGLELTQSEERAWRVADRDFRAIDRESKSKGKLSCYRFFFLRFEEELWLYGKIAGHKEGVFAEALQIAQSLELRADIPGRWKPASSSRRER
jgi:hypothetical protein